MPFSAEAFRHMAALYEALGSNEPEAMIAALKVAIEPLGVRYFQITQHLPGDGPSSFVPIVDTSPKLLSVESLAARFENFETWGQQFLTDARMFDADTVQIDTFPVEFQRLADEQRQIGGAHYFLTLPMFVGNACKGLATYFFERKPGEIEVKPLLNVLTQSAFEHVRTPVTEQAPCPLTPRQREALQHCAVGKSDWDIGVLMSVSAATAHDHIEAAKRRLGVRTRVQAVLAAFKNGWISV